MALTNIVLVGANGRLGPAVLDTLLAASTFRVTVLSRASSPSNLAYPSAVRVALVSDDPSIDELAIVLQAQDAHAVIVTVPSSMVELQLRLADAAVRAGVKRFIPADFGSCDSSSPRALSLMPLYKKKQQVRQYLQQLAAAGGITWTSLVCGHFFDFGLASGLLGFQIAEKSAKIFDGGDIRWSATTLATIGAAVVQVLRKDESTQNRMLYIQSFSLTQNELLRSLEKAAGTGWRVEHVNSAEYITKVKAEVDRHPHDVQAAEDLVGVVGMLDADWEAKDDFANGLLEMRAEDLDQVVRRVVVSHISRQK